METQIRIAVENDINQMIPLLIDLDLLHVQLYPDVFDEAKITTDIRKDFLLKHIDTPNNLFLIAETNSEIVGVVHCYIQETKDHPIKKDNKVAVLSDLFVAKPHRNKGIAQQLVKNALDIINEKWKLKTILLNVFDGNSEAINLYEKIGFQKQFSRYSITT
ncbi:MAG TPA: GNAT family N-acetyltransferase [Chitinophagales bacterium]|nr:GNAT family N-acetyltransferase [Chitinophagales bacterium]